MAPSTPTPTSPRIAPEVVERGDAAGRDDRTVGARADVTEQVEVGALEHAVLVDVGDDVAGAALAVEPREHLPEVAALAGPAAGREGACRARRDRRRPGRRGRRWPRRAHSGSSSAAVPMLTRRQPVASAASSDSSSRIPPEISTSMSSRPTISARSSRLVPRPNAASRSTRWIHSAPGSCQRSAASTGSPNAPRSRHALDELHGVAARDVDGGQQLKVGRRGRLAAGAAWRHRRRGRAGSGGVGAPVDVHAPGRGRRRLAAAAACRTAAPAASTRRPATSAIAGPGGRQRRHDACAERPAHRRRESGRAPPPRVAGAGRAARGALAVRPWCGPPLRPARRPRSSSPGPRRVGPRSAPPGGGRGTAHRPPTQFASSCSPASPDFSGWNWVALQRAVLDRGDEPVAAVLAPTSPAAPGKRRSASSVHCRTA